MDTRRVFSGSSSASDSSGEELGGLIRWASRGLKKSVMAALGGLGTRSGVPRLALGSSIKSVMDGKGRMVPGLSVSLSGSDTAAAASTGAWTGEGVATGGI